MAELKTKKTAVSVESFLNGVADLQQRDDAFRLLAIMKEVTGTEPAMWGPSIVGFGAYHYKYASGHEGDCCLSGFSPRKGTLTIYCMGGMDCLAGLLKKLGKHKASKGCLYVKKLEDIDLDVLREIIRANIKSLQEIYDANANAAAAKKSRKKK